MDCRPNKCNFVGCSGNSRPLDSLTMSYNPLTQLPVSHF